jgi:DNA polymerase IIIc chi subunit
LRALFFQIKNNKTKLQRVIETVNYHFTNNDKLLLIAPDDASVKYLDDLLWKVPINSFIPHFVSTNQIDEKIVITLKKENLNHSKYIFNLCPTPLMIEDINTIYEFEDFAAGKQILSRKKYETYKERKFFIESKLS